MSLFYIMLEVQLALVIVLQLKLLNNLGVLCHLPLHNFQPPVSGFRVVTRILMRQSDALLHVTLNSLHCAAHVLKACAYARMPSLTRGIEPH